MSWDDPEYYEEREQWMTVDEFVNFKGCAADWMEEVLHQVYNIGNVSLLENALEELAALLEVKFPKGTPRIEKKKCELFDLGVELMKSGSNQ